MTNSQNHYNTPQQLQSYEALKFYLDCLFPENSGWIELRPFSDQEDLFPHKYGARRWYPSVEAFLKKAPSIFEYLKDNRNGAFIGVLPRIESGVGKKEHIHTGYAIWSDIDDKDTGSRANTLKMIDSLSHPPSCVVESGGGCHVYYWLTEPAEGSDIEAANKLLIKATNGDRAASDRSRILRVPNSYHCKSDPVLVSFRLLNDNKYKLDDLINSLGGQNLFNLELEKEKKKHPVKKISHRPVQEISPSIDELMDKYPRIKALYNGIGKESGGQSPSEYDYAFARELLWYGATEIDTCNALQSKILDDQRQKPPHYIQRTVGKAAADVDRRKGKGKLKIVSRETIPQTPPDVAPLALERYPEDYSNKMLRGRPVSTMVNLLQLLRQRASGSDKQIRYNTFKAQIELYGSKIEGWKETKLMESVFVANRQEWESKMFARCLEAISREHPYHPVQEHLKRCHKKWIQDGRKERISAVFEKYCNTLVTYTKLIKQAGKEVEVETCKRLLLKELARCFFVGAVARVFEAGCKMETTLILKGLQGCGKSTFFKLLASNKDYKSVGELINDSPTWFCDSKIDVTDGRDSFSKLVGCWLYEFAELAATRKKEAEAIKAFLSSGMDKYSPKYARYDVEQKRQVVFCGTTNELEILRDLTGNRRFHVLEVGKVDLAGLLEVRDLLWGEAYQMYLDKKGYHLSKEHQNELNAAQERFKASDSWSDALDKWLLSNNNGGCYTTQEILSGAIGMDTDRQNRATSMRMAGILSSTGWTKSRKKEGTKRVWKWIPPTKEEEV